MEKNTNSEESPETTELQSICGRPEISQNLFSNGLLDFGSFNGSLVRIIGGNTAVPHSYPWQASIRSSYNSHFCGGSILSKNWVLTAAHCMPSADDLVVLGDHSVYGNSDGDFHRIKRTVFHPSYSNDAAPRFDFQLVELLDEILSFTNEILPICLSNTPELNECVVTGWGVNEVDSNASPEQLLQVKMPIIDDEICRNNYWSGVDFESMICAGDRDSGACNGDSAQCGQT